MGRGYIVDDSVEMYLSKLCEQQSDIVTGLVIGQNSPQRDFVVMACRTPSRDEPLVGVGKGLDKEWISEHARQVSRMLPGGLSVLGVFIITDVDAKETLASLRQLVFAVQSLISSEHLWNFDDNDEVTDCLTLQINPKSRKISCRTFDTKDPKSLAKPADWKYQSSVCSSWSMMSCFLNVDLFVPLPDNKACSKSMDKCLKDGLKQWTHQIENAVCLIDGVQLPDDAELIAGQKRNVRQKLAVQLLLTPDQQHSLTDVVQKCGGSLSLRGAIHGRAYVHNNKPKAKLAEKFLKRDVVATMVTRVQMLLDDLLATENESDGVSRDKNGTEQFCLPHRVFCPARLSGSLCVCDYQFNDEDPTEVIDRLKEMLDIDSSDQDLDTKQEIAAEIIECKEPAESTAENVEVQEPRRNNYMGVAMATVVALLATAASILYLSDF
ncbi:protein odr-4 homolog [Corythoichthys intestinalis]|uniref:protein odr-4 homolog n=1 Tax=Corythoichthys intestinalis TaxID=161448 RepID=UPI0025A53BCE|nr:protein odr-4 homolog [Corythoichthys intestinalis]XP_057712483.1 protein odr-4 homolog [Corythoichthys intestinalis]XP_057712484.1 protein odr-4 homolog [Corythoichthys intestinalis]XP_061795797.1 protein odr-4 homolog [Nerophis lumbriciformis]